MKNIKLLAIGALFLFLFGCLGALEEKIVPTEDAVAPAQNDSPVEENKTLVGGDRDEHGCIPSAGYSWCEPKQKCLRIWEEECE